MIVHLRFDALEGLVNHAELLRAEPSAFIATIAVHPIDLTARTISYVSAGHPPAILVRSGGSSSLVEAGR